MKPDNTSLKGGEHSLITFAQIYCLENNQKAGILKVPYFFSCIIIDFTYLQSVKSPYCITGRHRMLPLNSETLPSIKPTLTVSRPFILSEYITISPFHPDRTLHKWTKKHKILSSYTNQMVEQQRKKESALKTFTTKKSAFARNEAAEKLTLF